MTTLNNTTLNNTVFITISNPLEQFEVTNFIYLSGPLLGAKFSLTNIGTYLFIVTFLVLGIKNLIYSYTSYIAKALSLGLRLTASMIGIFVLVFLIFFMIDIYLNTVYPDPIVYSFIPIIVYNYAEMDKSRIYQTTKVKLVSTYGLM